MKTSTRLAFDRGTILLDRFENDGAVLAAVPDVRFDARVERYRAPTHRLESVRDVFTGSAMPGSIPVLPNADSARFHDPELPLQRLRGKEGKEAPHDRQDGGPILVLNPQHDDPRVLGRRVGSNVREVEVERDDHSSLGSADPRKVGIETSPKALVSHGRGILAMRSQQLRDFTGEVLVDFEPQHLMRFCRRRPCARARVQPRKTALPGCPRGRVPDSSR